MIDLVLQSDAKGCCVAVLAMVTGKSYLAVKSETADLWKEGGSDYRINQYLADHGFAVQYHYHYDQFKIEATEEHGTRYGLKDGPWPLPPFAPAHILLTRNEVMSHWIVMGPDGEILDPVFGRGRDTSQYEVTKMIGIWKVK
jgi:hypothetical protein